MLVALNAYFWGRETTGSGQYLQRLVAALAADHPDIELLLIAPKTKNHSEQTHSVTILDEHQHRSFSIRWHICTTPFDAWHPQLAKLWFEQIAYPRAAAQEGATLLHVPYFAAPFRASRPVVVTIHDVIPILLPTYRGSLLVRAYTALVSQSSRRAKRILADSEASRRDILQHLSVSPPKVQTVYLGVEAKFRRPPPAEIEQFRQARGLPPHFVLYLGGFDIRKGVPTLLEATAHSQGTWPLVIAGKLPTQESAFAPDPRRLVREYNLQPRVILTGWIPEEEKPLLLSAASLFVFPSIYEGFGLPLLEAMACGLPAITTTASSLPELAGSAAATVPPGDAVALARMIDSLMADERSRQEFAAQAPLQAAQFTWSRCACQTANVYRSIGE